MKTRSVKYKSAPGYPSRRQYLEYRALAGAAAIGLSAMTGGCRETVLGGIRYVKPEQVSNQQPDKTQVQPKATDSAKGANMTNNSDELTGTVKNIK